jgi:hypothetical protein
MSLVAGAFAGLALDRSRPGFLTRLPRRRKGIPQAIGEHALLCQKG